MYYICYIFLFLVLKFKFGYAVYLWFKINENFPYYSSAFMSIFYILRKSVMFSFTSNLQRFEPYYFSNMYILDFLLFLSNSNKKTY